LSERQLFNFVTDSKIEDLDEYINFHLNNPAEQTDENQVTESVFKNAFIPNSLSDVKKPFEDYEALMTGHDKADVFHNLISVETEKNQEN